MEKVKEVKQLNSTATSEAVESSEEIEGGSSVELKLKIKG